MSSNLETLKPTAADYRALIDRFNIAARAHNSGEIDFPTFRRLVAELEDETRILNFRRKLERTCRSIAQEQTPGVPSDRSSSLG